MSERGTMRTDHDAAWAARRESWRRRGELYYVAGLTTLVAVVAAQRSVLLAAVLAGIVCAIGQALLVCTWPGHTMPGEKRARARAQGIDGEQE